MHLRFNTIVFILLYSIAAFSQTTHVVNSNDDIDDGVCNAAHCSFREAINAANTDGTSSIITFNIPGAGPQTIIPPTVFPDITASDLFIDGETQTGGLGNIVISFNSRDFGTNDFLRVLAPRTHINGIMFKDMRYVNNINAIVRVGTATQNADNSKITNCSFHTDNLDFTNLTPSSVIVANSNNFVFSKNIIGGDYAKNAIFLTHAGVYFNSATANQKVGALIDSSYFMSTIVGLKMNATDGIISNNLFGSFDTTGLNGFVTQESGIVSYVSNLQIRKNYFISHAAESCILETTSTATSCVISNNRFINSTSVAIYSKPDNINLQVTNNYGRNLNYFLNYAGNNTGQVIVNDNIIQNASTFYYTSTSIPSLSAFDRNTILCSTSKPINYNNLSGAPLPPVITSVNRTEIKGTAIPNNVVQVYSNPRTNCPNTVCQGGTLLGKTVADNAGNWTLNANYPNRTKISAYQHENKIPAPLVYSEFSNCFACTTPTVINITPTLCTNETFVFRGTTYSAANPTDRITVVGDGVSICDTVFNINVTIQSAIRRNQMVNLCYKQTVQIGTVTLSENKLIDSLTLKTTSGCDSIVILQGIIRGVYILDTTICGATSLRIGNQTFDATNSSGIATISGGSFFNCDSVIIATVRFGSTKGFYTLDLCPGDSVLIEGTYFSDRRPTGQIMLTSYLGCDSLLNVSLTILPNKFSFIKQDICRGDTIMIQNEKFFSGKTSGNVQLTNMASNGCDSIIQIDLTVLLDAIGTLDTSLCENQTLTLHGQIFSKQRPSGNIRIDNASHRGCDSFVMVRVTFVSETLGFVNQTICRKSNIKIQNTIYDINNPTGSERIIGGSSAGCDSLIQVNLRFYPELTVEFMSQDLSCNTANTGALFLDLISGGAGTFTYSIDNKTATPYSPSASVSNLSKGIHTVKITDSAGCDTTFTFEIFGSKVLSLNLPNDTTIEKGTSIQINSQANFSPFITTWNPTSFLSCTNCINPIASPDQTTTYVLIAEDSMGCKIQDQMTIQVIVKDNEIWVPTTFSPNGDRINDLFYPKFKFPEKSRITVFKIYDRWGEEVFSKTNGNFEEDGEIYGWDGMFGNDPLMPGVYTYIIEYETKDLGRKWANGSVTLLK